VFINACFRPRVFLMEGTNVKSEPKASKASWLGLGLSIVLLVIVVLGFNYWFTFFSGGIQWWYVVAPYASGNLAAIAVTVTCAVILIALMWYTLLRKKGEVVK
jgi:energy-coupling factor transporter transmembrane protein EcfT